MKKITSLILLLSYFCIISVNSQVINEPANWPNSTWSINVIADTDGLLDIEADPSVDANFAFDDDDSGSASHDIVAAESPVIDLTAAQTANENLIIITSEYSYNWVDTEEYFAIEYWDADAADWTSLFVFLQEDVPGIGTNDWCNTGKRPYIGTLDISSFTATQLSGFRYRYIYNDDITGGDGWNWGFCIESPTLSSSGVVVPPGCASNPTPADGANIVVVIGFPGNTISWDAPTTGDPVIAYDIFFGDTPTTVTDFFATVSETFDTVFYNGSELGSTKYWKVVPKNAGGSAVNCPVWSFTLQDPPPQPAYDVCATAQDLTIGVNFADNVFNATTSGATASGETPDPTCGIFGGGNDVWFSVTVPASGNVTVEIQVDGATDNLVDTVMSAYSGSCGSLTELVCNDDNPIGGTFFSLISLTGQTPNDVLYFRVFAYENAFQNQGTFLISAYDNPSANVSDNSTFNLTIGPNPVDDVLTINANEPILNVKIYNFLGQEIKNEKFGYTSVNLNLRALEKGPYIGYIESKVGIEKFKFIKK